MNTMKDPEDASAQKLSVMELGLPPSHYGITWEVLTGEHLHSLATLVQRMEAQDNPPYRTSVDEVAQMLDNTGHWYGVAGFATRGIARGRMVAYAHVTFRQSIQPECVCQGGVDPSFRRLGLGGALVDWQETTARRVLTEICPNEDSQIVAHVESGQDDFEQALKARGFQWRHTFYEMRANLKRIPDTPMLGHYLTIEQWGPQWEEPARQAANMLSEREWGLRPLTQEQWLQGRTSFVPEWSFLAVDTTGDRPKIAGFLLASRYEQDWTALGWKEGYIDQMGVLEEWKYTHVVDALIIASMNAQARDGMERIGAGLGSAHHSGALAVYDYLGFTPVGQSRLYAIDLP